MSELQNGHRNSATIFAVIFKGHPPDYEGRRSLTEVRAPLTGAWAGAPTPSSHCSRQMAKIARGQNIRRSLYLARQYAPSRIALSPRSVIIRPVCSLMIFFTTDRTRNVSPQ